MQNKSETKEVDYTFSLDTKLFDRQTARSAQLLSSEFYSQEEIKTLFENCEPNKVCLMILLIPSFKFENNAKFFFERFIGFF